MKDAQRIIFNFRNQLGFVAEMCKKYKSHEVETILMSTLSGSCCENRIDNAMKLRKSKKNET